MLRASLSWAVTYLAAMLFSVAAFADSASSGASVTPPVNTTSSDATKSASGATITKKERKRRKKRASAGSDAVPTQATDKDKAAQGGDGTQASRPSPNPRVVAELDADCVVFERIEPEPRQASYVFSKFFVRLADGTKEVREVEVNINKEYGRAKVGDKLCARPPKYPD